jgi:TldD protein
MSVSNCSIPRREFLASASVLATGALLPHSLMSHPGARWWIPQAGAASGDGRWTNIDPTTIKTIAMRAVGAAMAAGAQYADARVTRTQFRNVSFIVIEGEGFDVGIRALVNGRWGMVGTTIWTTDEAARVGQDAVQRAKALRDARRAEVVLAPAPVVHDGVWTMPVDTDPIYASVDELYDEVNGILNIFAIAPPEIQVKLQTNFQRQDKAFASSEGSYTAQTMYQSSAELSVIHRNLEITSDRFTVAGRGWEYIRGHLHTEVLALMAEAERLAALPIKPAVVGKYDIVMDGWGVAQLVDDTIGAATELDRAMGYEANAEGTSYLSTPLTMRGTERIGTSALDVTADRSMVGGAATVGWDDDGVAPDVFPLVRQGVVVDFQTGRESASWLAPSSPAASDSARASVHSHGCATAQTASAIPLVQCANLRMAPGTTSADLDELVAGCAAGWLVTRSHITPDPNCSSGMGLGTICEIRNGKVVARIGGAAFLYRAKELWGNLHALGGVASLRQYGIERFKGEPRQQAVHTVEAPPAAFKQVSCLRIGGAI